MNSTIAWSGRKTLSGAKEEASLPEKARLGLCAWIAIPNCVILIEFNWLIGVRMHRFGSGWMIWI